MQQIFIEEELTSDILLVTGEDAHHLLNVVRLKAGEKFRVSTPSGKSFICALKSSQKDSFEAEVLEESKNTELKNKIYLFQAVPKGDRMETVIEKCVELGVFEIIPVEMKNCIVKLDDKKKKSKLIRFNTIAKTAAMQSKRSLVPQVSSFMTFKEAAEFAKSLDLNLFLYENKNGMKDTYSILDSIKEGMSIGVFIGPEGGFDKTEVEIANENMQVLSLGSRILRTDTAAITALSMLMLKCEEFLQ